MITGIALVEIESVDSIQEYTDIEIRCTDGDIRRNCTDTSQRNN